MYTECCRNRLGLAYGRLALMHTYLNNLPLSLPLSRIFVGESFESAPLYGYAHSCDLRTAARQQCAARCQYPPHFYSSASIFFSFDPFRPLIGQQTDARGGAGASAAFLGTRAVITLGRVRLHIHGAKQTRKLAAKAGRACVRKTHPFCRRLNGSFSTVVDGWFMIKNNS